MGTLVVAVVVAGVGALSTELLSWMQRASSCWEEMTRSFSSPGSAAAKIHRQEALP